MRTKKGAALGIIVLLTLLGGTIFYAATKPLPARAPGTVEAPTLSGSSYREQAPYYAIAANYASSTPLLNEVGSAADTEAVGLMKQFVSDTISQFKTNGNFANLSANDVKMMGFDQGRKEKLQINYLIASSSRTISYIFTVYEDTLGAHGNTTFKTFTFDTKTGVLLTLEESFMPGSRYLETLSRLSRAKLPELVGDGAQTNMINEGTTPEKLKSANFFFDNDTFVLLFAPYEVAPYSSGPQTLRILVSELAGILKPEYR